MPSLFDQFDFVIQPGWRNSGPTHWQSHWQYELGARRVHTRNWDQPGLSDWQHGLQAALAGCARPAIVIAHSLGCINLAHLAQRQPTAIAGALLVAPADVERPNVPAEIAGFGPIPRTRLPFPSRLVASTNDPYCQT
jgi:predicted alpha/beta hydrolase family esterase